MNEKNSEKKTLKTTPKKSSKTRRKPNLTPNKSTPVKTRSKSLPKSPISESMKQSKINDFFKPISPSIDFKQMSSSSQEISPQISNEKTKKSIETIRKGPKLLEPILGQKRYNLRKSNETDFAKKLKFDTSYTQNDTQNQSLNDDKNDLNNSFVKQISANNLDTNQNSSVNDLQNNIKKKCRHKRVCDCDPKLNQLMIHLSLNSPNKIDSNSSQQMSAITDKQMDNLMEKQISPLKDDMDLIPVFTKPQILKSYQCSEKNNCDQNLFKIPEIPNKKKNQFKDKEKDKKMSYFLKNLNRIKRDKEILSLQSVEEMESELSLNKCNFEEDLTTSFGIKEFKGIDIFCDISIENSSEEETENILDEIEFSRLSFLPSFDRSLNESERQRLLSQLFRIVSSEDYSLIHKIEDKLIEILSQKDYEISLSNVLKDFYQILSKISNNIFSFSFETKNEDKIESELIFLSNIVRVIYRVLNKSSFIIEAIDSAEEYTKLLITLFSLCLDYRVIKNNDMISNLKNLIEVLFNKIFIDEFKITKIINNLISFCKREEKPNAIIGLHIVSLFPINVDFELRRKFCISIIKLFAEEITRDFELNLSEIQNILEEINWNSLTLENIYLIIEMIGSSLDFPKDLFEHKQTISNIMAILDNKINSCASKGSDLQFKDIRTLFTILRTKVMVSTKK